MTDIEQEGEAPRAFEIASGAIVVANPDGRVLRSPVPEGVSPTAFRHTLAAVDIWWGSRGTFPTPRDVQSLWDKIPLKTYQTIFATPEFEMALEARGIPTSNTAGLTEKQAFALQILTNPGDVRSTTAKLKDIGVTYSTFQNWMKQPLFSRLYRERTENLLQDIVPAAIVGLSNNVESGNQKAIEFALEMSGRYNPKAIEAENARVVVLRLLELIQQYAPLDVRQKIEEGLDATLRGVRVSSAMKEIT